MAKARMRHLSVAAALVLAVIPSYAAAKMRVAGEGVDRFHPHQSDYAIDGDACGQGRVTRLHVDLSGRTRSKVGARRPFGRSRAVRFRLADGQAVRIRALNPSGGSRLYVFRCLPDDFVGYTYTRVGSHRPSHGLFAVDPISIPNVINGEGNYAIIFSRWGAPIWWRHDPREGVYLDTTILSDGRIATAQTYGAGGFGTDPRQQIEIFEPDGRRSGTVRAVGSITDNHEILETRGGNFIIASYVPREQPVDAGAFNGDDSANVVDSVIQKVSPGGRLLWSWDAAAHVDLSETDRWWSGLTEPYDIHHLNSVDIDRSGDLLVSLRHTDAVYKIDGRRGTVLWKLGGTETAESLRIRGDEHGDDTPLGGQHDARFLGRGRISVHANQSVTSRPARAVIYRIRDGVAKLVRSTLDPSALLSGCCGSARVLPGGNWLISWGGHNLVTELTPGGKRRMKLEFAGGSFSYRAQPAPAGATSAEELRKGMNRQYRRRAG